MAIFNFPIQHDDHPDRAILARGKFRSAGTRRETLDGEGGSALGRIAIGIAWTAARSTLANLAGHITTSAMGTVVNSAARAIGRRSREDLGDKAAS